MLLILLFFRSTERNVKWFNPKSKQRNFLDQETDLNSDMKVWKQNLVVIIVLTVISSLPYLPGASDQFVFDDIPGVKTNQDVHNPDPSGILMSN